MMKQPKSRIWVHIPYENMEFPCRELLGVDGKTVTIAPMELFQVLYHDGKFVDKLAESIDQQVARYVDHKYLVFDNNDLVKLLIQDEPDMAEVFGEVK